jgi:hypothetical protein
MFIAAFVLATFAFVYAVFVLVPPHAEAGRATVNVVESPSPCPAAAAKWCHEVGGLDE